MKDGGVQIVFKRELMKEVCKPTKRLLLGVVLFFSFLSVSWSVDVSNYFIMDDYTLFYDSLSTTYVNCFSLLPRFRYNDRPFRLIVFKLLISKFSFNAVIFHLIFVIIHLLIVFVLYKSIRIWINGEESFFIALVSAGIFGIYPKSLMTVSWSSGVDLLCGLFVVISLYCYIRYLKWQKHNNLFGILSLLSYIISLRFKEMSLALPLCFLIFDITDLIHNKKKLHLRIYTYLSMIWMFIYIATLFSYPPITEYYYEQSFNPIILVKNLFRYLGLYTDLQSSDFGYTGLNIQVAVGMLLFTALLVLSILRIIKKKDLLLLPWTVGMLVIFTPVLPQINMQQKLYLYIPSMFIGVFMSNTLYQGFKLLEIRKKNAFVVIFIVCLWLCNYTPGIVGHKEFWKSIGLKDHNEIIQVQRLSALIPNSTVYVKGASDNYNIINPYGPGHVLNLIYNDITIKTVLVDEFPELPEYPYVFWEYDGKTFTELESDLSVRS